MQNSERHNRVTYLPMFSQGEIKVLVHRRNTSSSNDGIFFLHTFSALVWILIFVLFIVFTFLKILDRRFEPPDPLLEPASRQEGWVARIRHFILHTGMRRRLRKASLNTAFEMVGHSDHSTTGMMGNSTRQSVLALVIALSGLFFVLSYEASMTARLVQERLSAAYRTADDFRQCRIASADVCIPRGGAIEFFWRNSIAASQCNAGRMPQLLRESDGGVGKVVSGACKFLLAGVSAGDAMTGRYCGQVLKVGKPVLWGGNAFVLPLNSSLYEELGRVTLDLREEGKLKTIDEYYAKRGECAEVDGTALDFQKLKVFFILAFSSCFVVFVSMVIFPQSEPRTVPRQQSYIDSLHKLRSRSGQKTERYSVDVHTGQGASVRANTGLPPPPPRTAEAFSSDAG